MEFIRELQNEKKMLEARLLAVDNLLKAYNVESIETKGEDTNSIKDKFIEATHFDRFLLALKHNDRFMKIREIAEYISDHIDEDVESLVKQLSRTTGKLKKLNKITSYKAGNTNKSYYWGSPKWLDNDGNIINGYEYKKNKNEPLRIEL